METYVNQFWSYFNTVRYDIQEAFEKQDKTALKLFVKKLTLKISKINDKLDLILNLSDNEKHSLIICIHKNTQLKPIQNQLINNAPYIDNWSFEAGVKPYSKKQPMGFYFEHKNMVVLSDQVFIHLYKIYNSSNKLHIHVYFDLGISGVAKYQLKDLANYVLLFYLGDTLFYEHISRIKVVRRRLKSVNFIPLHELKHLIEFKSPY
tara:strand:- start:8717 stop:9334 length:618 start_codon:yes stop_codon:yes gene_type:complete